MYKRTIELSDLLVSKIRMHSPVDEESLAKFMKEALCLYLLLLQETKVAGNKVAIINMDGNEEKKEDIKILMVIELPFKKH
jgi:hypothetical protein